MIIKMLSMTMVLFTGMSYLQILDWFMLDTLVEIH